MVIKISIRKFPDGGYQISDSIPGSRPKPARAPSEAGLITQTYKMLYPGKIFDVEYYNGFSKAQLDKDIAQILKGDKAFRF